MSIINVLPSQPPIYLTAGSLPSNATTGSEAVVLTSPPTIYLFDGTTWNAVAGGGVSSITGIGVNGQIAIWDSVSDLSAIAISATSGTSNVVSRDSSGNSYFNNSITGYRTTVTAAGTTTLTVASAELQYFTGSTTQTVLLPVTSTLVLGQSFTIVNNSSGVVTIQSSGANTIQALTANTMAIVTCILLTGTTAASWNVEYVTGTSGTVTSVALTVPSVLSIAGSPITTSGTLAIGYSGTALPIANGGTSVTSVTTTPTASSFAGWDANSNLSANDFFIASTTTVSSGSTVAMTAASTGMQLTIGISTQQFNLPAANTVAIGSSWFFGNLSTGAVSICNNGGSGLYSLAQGGFVTATVLVNTTANGSWTFRVDLTANATSTTAGLSHPGTISAVTSVSAPILVSTVSTGTAPLTVTSTTQVANLNAATAGSATSFSGSLVGDVTGTQGATVLSATTNSTLTTLSGLTTASSLATVGTITSGTWSGTAIAIAKGGTNSTTSLSNGFLIVSAGGKLVEGGQAVAATNSQSGTSYVVVTGDFGKLVRLTNTAARAITLPTTPSDGYWVKLEDTAGTAYTANITVTAGGSDTFTYTGNGTLVIDSEFATVMLQYCSSAAKWEIV